ncbi:hypothetical protein [Marinobacterium sedimentorum]|uniref:hypothetical protein n=1 Tax=Marinobacterium sedimentorum TaxID=2927804 RepID=UPI0020C73BC9|nr:hypothetical protein [Marinobacterium sedimentorum]MCP8686728.1 hypothetical protein [Marinobacterium sedimentorum]
MTISTNAVVTACLRRVGSLIKDPDTELAIGHMGPVAIGLPPITAGHGPGLNPFTVLNGVIPDLKEKPLLTGVLNTKG